MTCERAYEGVVSLLRAFAQMGVYGPLDRMAGALTADAVENALYDALRSMNAYMRQAVRVKFKGKEKPILIIDWTPELGDVRYALAEEGEVEEGPEELKGKKLRFVRAPYLPSEEELRSFIDKVREGIEGLRLARELALKALSPYRGG